MVETAGVGLDGRSETGLLCVFPRKGELSKHQIHPNAWGQVQNRYNKSARAGRQEYTNAEMPVASRVISLLVQPSTLRFSRGAFRALVLADDDTRAAECKRLLVNRRRDARHGWSDAALSPDGRPSRSPSTEMSSSRSGQWMPMPGPTSSQLRRSLGRASAKRGYHSRGTETRRPSPSSTRSAISLTRTFLAVAISVAGLEEVMPRLQKYGPVFLHQRSVHSEGIRRPTPPPRVRARTSRPSARVRRGRAVVRADRSRRRRTGTDHFGEPSDSPRRFCQLSEKAGKLISRGDAHN